MAQVASGASSALCFFDLFCRCSMIVLPVAVQGRLKVGSDRPPASSTLRNYHPNEGILIVLAAALSRVLWQVPGGVGVG